MPATTSNQPANPSANQRRELEHQAKEDAAQACMSARQFFQAYARERPEVVALWTFGLGFIMGWRLRR